ncbi:MAG: hypothetical protein IPP57_02760 [Candidatus Obscuribacter sp.]|nr:hypothetical protein [Candidatus Obscuribacter sp.]MBK9769746.1 hypothetical protein [Candidatus Obscuribacter sp.]
MADSIKLSQIKSLDGREFIPQPLKLTDLPAPAYIQFAVAPLVGYMAPLDSALGQAEVRVKLYDYGTVSLRFSFPFTGTWQEFLQMSRKLRFAEEIQQAAWRSLEQILASINDTLSKPHKSESQKEFLEDYFVAEVESFVTPMTAGELLREHSGALATLVSVEEKPLSYLQVEEAMKECFSYCENELTVLTWDQAFVFDDRAGADTVDSIIEFANTQLVELRTYDRRLDRHLDEIYRSKSESLRTNVWQSWTSGRLLAERQAERLRHLLVDVRELSDRATNAIKIIGCAYYARLYGGIASRLSLSQWQKQVETKLDCVGELYRYSHDQAELARSEFLEMIVIFLIALEVLIGIFGRSH